MAATPLTRRTYGSDKPLYSSARRARLTTSTRERYCLPHTQGVGNEYRVLVASRMILERHTNTSSADRWRHYTRLKKCIWEFNWPVAEHNKEHRGPCRRKQRHVPSIWVRFLGVFRACLAECYPKIHSADRSLVSCPPRFRNNVFLR